MKTTISGIAVVATASVALCRASTAAADEAMRFNAQSFKPLKVCAAELILWGPLILCDPMAECTLDERVLL